MEENKMKAMMASPDVAIAHMLDEMNKKLDVVTKALEGLDLSEVDSIKGDSPQKGTDYFTDEELDQIKEIVKSEVMPVKGVHYFDGESPDIEEIINEVLKRLNK